MSLSFEKSMRQLRTGREILLALKSYGVLSERSLRHVLNEPSVGKIHQAILRLIDLELIQRIHYKFENNHGSYYYFASGIANRLLVAKMLGGDADSLKLECIRHAELPHEQRCARLQHDLKQMFPNATIYRDYQLDRSKVSELVFPATAIEKRLYPDILLHNIDESRKYGEAFIAFEVEESLKSRARLLDKLHRYSTESLLSGVVYLSTKDQIGSTIYDVFRNKVLERNLRIKHYGNNFLLFQLQSPKQDGLDLYARNLDGKKVKLDLWMKDLMSTKDIELGSAQLGVDVTTRYADYSKGEK